MTEEASNRLSAVLTGLRLLTGSVEIAVIPLLSIGSATLGSCARRLAGRLGPFVLTLSPGRRLITNEAGNNIARGKAN